MELALKLTPTILAIILTEYLGISLALADQNGFNNQDEKLYQDSLVNQEIDNAGPIPPRISGEIAKRNKSDNGGRNENSNLELNDDNNSLATTLKPRSSIEMLDRNESNGTIIRPNRTFEGKAGHNPLSKIIKPQPSSEKESQALGAKLSSQIKSNAEKIFVENSKGNKESYNMEEDKH